MNLKKLIKSKHLQIVSFIVGAIGGLIYWKLVGCKNGICPIKSVWYWTMLWGAAFGYLVGDITNDIIQKGNNKRGEVR